MQSQMNDLRTRSGVRHGTTWLTASVVAPSLLFEELEVAGRAEKPSGCALASAADERNEVILFYELPL